LSFPPTDPISPRAETASYFGRPGRARSSAEKCSKTRTMIGEEMERQAIDFSRNYWRG